jgi:hypothetical protein
VQHDEQFQKEAISLKGIQHPNVIRLLGYCLESKGEITELPNGEYVIADNYARMLCFEYVCNGGLDKHLSGTFWKHRTYFISSLFSFSEVYIVRTRLHVTTISRTLKYVTSIQQRLF